MEAERAQQIGDANRFRDMSAAACLFMIRHAGVETAFASVAHSREFVTALERLSSAKDRAEMARAGGLHAVALAQFGDFLGCVGFGHPSLRLLQDHSGFWNRLAVVELVASLGDAYRALGEYAEAAALDALHEEWSKELHAKRPPPPWQAAIYDAMQLWAQNRNTEAIAILEAELSVERGQRAKGKDRAYWTAIIEARLRSYKAFHGGLPDEVLSAAEAEANLAWHLPKANFDLAPELLLAAIEFAVNRKGDLDRARGLAYRALAYSRIVRTPQTLRFRVLRVAMRSAASAAEAILLGKLAVAEVMSARIALTALDHTLGAAETGELAQLFEQVVSLLVDEGRIAEAAVIMSLRRQKEIDPFGIQDRSGLYRDRPLLVAPEETAAMGYYAARNHQDADEIAALFRQMGAMIARAADEAEDARGVPFRSPMDAKAFDLVDATTAVLQIMPSLDATTVLVTTMDGGHAHRCEMPGSEVNLYVFEALQKIRARAHREDVDALRALHAELIEPILPQLNDAGVSRLVISASGSLQSLPFAVLHDGKRWLVEQFSIVRAPIDAQLLRIRPQYPPTLFIGGTARGETGINGRLHHIIDELERIRAIASAVGTAEFAINMEFTAEWLMRALREATILVVGAHCIGEPLAPRKSRLLLGNDTTIALEGLAVPSGRADLIVLSACETGGTGSTLTPGLDLSIDRLLNASGARSIISTAWSIDDEAQSVLMPQFFVNLLRDHLTKDAALAEAQRAMLRGELRAEDRRDWSAPYYWAGPMLTGNWLAFGG
jgi:CHAT domain-containing protein